MKAPSKLTPSNYDPIRAIEWVIAILTALGGLYAFTPSYHHVTQTQPSALASALASPALVKVFAAVVIIGALILICGLAMHKVRLLSAGLFIILLVRIFQFLITVIVSGFFPFTPWIFLFTVTVIVFLLWLNVRLRVTNNGRA